MRKRYLAAGRFIWLFIGLIQILLVVGSILITQKVLARDLKSFNDYFGVIISIFFSWSITLGFLFFIITQIWIIEIDQNGIEYKNLFKFRKFHRCFSWAEIIEIEIIKVFPFKYLYISKANMSFGQKLFANKKDENCTFFIYQKRLRREIKKFCPLVIIEDRNTKNSF